jgi:DNA-binding transcriptional MerR regulator
MNRAGSYRIREFAALAGVTVRALHHYDRFGLLEPHRTTTGYRVYSVEDLRVLEQIVALKFIGLPLKQIKGLLRRSPSELAQALRAQRTVIEQKRNLLDRAIAAIRDAELALQTGKPADSALFTHIIEVIEMQNNTDEWKKQYDGLVQGKIEHLKAMSPEKRADLQTQWTNLLKDIEASLNEDPASPRAQELATRWVTLLAAFAPGGHLAPSLVKAFGAAYQQPDESGKHRAGVKDRRVWDFIGKAIALR